MREIARSASAAKWVKQLGQSARADVLTPIAVRFVYSLRLIALHERAKQDPLPELVVRLGGVEVAAKSLALAQTVSDIWPDPIHVSRFCCQFLSHDETALGALIDSASRCDRVGFEHSIEGLIRPDRMHRLWDRVLALIAAESRRL